MNRQEIFDKAYLAILQQGRPSIGNMQEDGNMQCLYRGRRGAKCAIGHLIPDDLYQPDIENRSPYVLLQPQEIDDAKQAVFRLILNKIFPDAGKLDVEFLHALQEAHDKAAPAFLLNDFLPTFKARAEEVALAYGLTIPSEPCQ